MPKEQLDSTEKQGFALEEKNVALNLSSQKVEKKHQKDKTHSLGLEVTRKFDLTGVPEERNRFSG